SPPRLRHGALADDNPQRSRRTTAYQCEINSIPDALGSEQPHYFPHTLDWFAIPGGDDITDENSRARRRSFRIDAHDENAAPAARRLRHARARIDARLNEIAHTLAAAFEARDGRGVAVLG